MRTFFGTLHRSEATESSNPSARGRDRAGRAPAASPSLGTPDMLVDQAERPATSRGGIDRDFSRIPLRAEAPIRTRTWGIARYPFRATIRRAWREPRAEGAPVARARSDAPPGREHGGEEHLALFEQLGAVPAQGPAPPAGSVSGEVAPGETGGEPSAIEAPRGTVRVPDVVVPELAGIGKSDAVRGGFTYAGSITRGGAAPSGFGVTRSFDSRLTDVDITHGAGRFDVAATFEHPITYQVRSGTGPDGQVDIASENDDDITAANYATVASDLTPDMSDLNGRPPRTGFWAEDLTLRHELVHARDDRSNGPGAMRTVTTWLNGQTAADEAGVRALLLRLPPRFATALLAALSTEEGERRAYGDGAPHYRARADAVRAKGDEGEYS